jgi:hypothetical protein
MHLGLRMNRVMISTRIALLRIAFCTLLLSALLPLASPAKTLAYEGTMRNQTVQESAKARLKLNIEGEKVTGYWTTFPPLQGSGPVIGVYRGGKCELSVTIDEDTLMELKGSCRDDGFDGAYVITIESPPPQQRNSFLWPQHGSFLLKPVALLNKRDAVEQHSPADEPGKGVGGFENAPPIGDYGVYQHTGTLGYDFLYRLRFLNEREYMAYESTHGNYTYDPKTRQFVFTSGPLTAYTGQYFTQEKGGLGKPKIVLRRKTTSASANSSAILREYLYAFHRPEGIQ